MKNSLYGIYPGKLKYDTNYIKNCSEIELFTQVNKYYEISDTLDDINEYEYALDFCILQTERFNTKVMYNPNGRVLITDEFKTWYNNWQLYISTMDDETLAAYRRYRYEGKHLDTFKLDNEIIDEPQSIKTYSHKLTKKSIKQISA